jgi:hypothetical protein
MSRKTTELHQGREVPGALCARLLSFSSRFLPFLSPSLNLPSSPSPPSYSHRRALLTVSLSLSPFPLFPARPSPDSETNTPSCLPLQLPLLYTTTLQQCLLVLLLPSVTEKNPPTIRESLFQNLQVARDRSRQSETAREEILFGSRGSRDVR